MNMGAKTSSLFRRLLWAVCLAVGFGTVWTVVTAWLYSAVDAANSGAARSVQFYEQLVVHSSGTPFIVRRPYENPPLTTYHDLSGEAQEPPDYEMVEVISMAGVKEPGFFSGEPGWAERLRFFVNDRSPSDLWYFVHDGKPEGAGYFVGYEQGSNRRIGFIGLAGFRANPVPAAEWIPVRSPLAIDFSYWSSAPASFQAWSGRALRPEQGDLPPHLVFVPSGNRLRAVNLATGTVQTVFETAEPIEAVGIPMLSFFTGGLPLKERPILVRTARQIQALDRDYKVKRVFTIPTEADSRSPVDWFELADGQALAAFPEQRRHRGRASVTTTTIYRIAGDGTIRERKEVALETGSSAMNEQAQTHGLALIVPVPALLIAIEPVILRDAGFYQSYGAGFVALFQKLWPPLAILAVVIAVLAALAVRRSRAFGDSRREQLVWGLFVLVFGLPAFVGFMLQRHWPSRLPCQYCHARAPRDRNDCCECGTPFPAPALSGIEIFA